MTYTKQACVDYILGLDYLLYQQAMNGKVISRSMSCIVWHYLLEQSFRVTVLFCQSINESYHLRLPIGYSDKEEDGCHFE